MSRYGTNSKQKQKSVVTYQYEEGESSNSAGTNDVHFKTNTNMRVKRNFSLQYDFCHLKVHTREQCYKLIGYPSDFKFTRNKNKENNVSEEEILIENTMYIMDTRLVVIMLQMFMVIVLRMLVFRIMHHNSKNKVSLLSSFRSSSH